MNHRKKWMVTLSDDQYDWIRQTAKEVKITGSAVIQELIGRTMRTKDREFKRSLVEAQIRIRREELQERKASIEAELNKLEAPERDMVG